MSRTWRWLAGAVVLAAVVWRVGGGPLVDGVRSVDVPVLLLGVVVAVGTTVAAACRWRLVARELGVAITLPAAVAACYRAQLLNTVLPGGVVGDVHRGLAHGRSTGETGRALRAVGWERFAGQVVQAGVAVLVLALLPSPVRPLLPWAVALVVAVAVGVLLVLARTPEGDAWWCRAARVVRDDARLALLVRRSWPGVLVASTCAMAGYVATYVVAARAVGVDAPLPVVLPLAVAVLVVAGLPLNLAGWGPREGMAAWVFGAAGLGAGTGVATAVAYGAIVLVGNLPGAVVLARDAARRPVDQVAEGGRVHA